MGCVYSCLEVQSVCVDLLCGREKLYICVCVDFLLRGEKIVWLWTFCAVVQNIYRLLVWKWKMFFIGGDFKWLQQPKKVVLERFYVLTNNPNFLLFFDILCLNCVTWLVISVVYLDFIPWLCTFFWRKSFKNEKMDFVNHFENSFFKMDAIRYINENLEKLLFSWEDMLINPKVAKQNYSLSLWGD